MKSFIKKLMAKGKDAIQGPKVYPDIKSVKPTTDIPGSVKRVKDAAARKNFVNVRDLKDKKAKGKKMFKEAQTELRRATETKRATKIGKDYYGRAVPADKADLRNEASVKMFKLAKGKDLEKKAKGGRVGKKFGGGADMGSKKLSPKQMKIASLAGNKKKIDAPDFKKLRAMKSPISKSVRKS